MIQSNESESCPSLTQLGITPSDNVDNSNKDQSQSPTEVIPPLTDDDVDECELTNQGNRKKTYDVWNHFKRKTINGEQKVVCNYCNKALTGKRTDGTNHLNKHYLSCKRKPYRDIRQAILLREQKKTDRSSSYLRTIILILKNQEKTLLV